MEKPSKTIRNLALALILPLAACGQDSATETLPSETFSLTGYPACYHYRPGLLTSDYVCMRLTYPGGSHRDTDVQVELRGYPASQRPKMIEAVKGFEKAWNAMYAHGGSVNDSAFGACIKRNSPTELFGPKSIFPTSAQNLETAISWSMLSLRYMFEYHEENLLPILVEGKVLADNRMAEAQVGQDGANSDTGTIYMNTNFIDGYDASVWSGALMHEWLHRKGWRHQGEYDTSLISIADECIHKDNMVGLGLSESVKIRYD